MLYVDLYNDTGTDEVYTYRHTLSIPDADPIVAARHEPHPQPVHGGARGGGGAGAPDRRGRPERVEPVPELGRGRQPGCVDLHRVVGGRRGAQRTRGYDPTEVRVGGHLPCHVGGRPTTGARGGSGVRGDPAPQDHPVRPGVTRGDTVAERPWGGLRGGRIEADD